MYEFESQLWSAGTPLVAGVDEAGRGPLAGPVVAAAVVLDPADPIEHLNDSKKLTPAQRESLLEEILGRACAVAVAAAGPRAIEKENILRASLRSMAVAVGRLCVVVGHVLIDGNQEIPLEIPQTTIVSGDAKSASIAAASIVAKVARDRFMERMDRKFPQYGFARHKGYPTRDHIRALQDHGPCLLHRRTFSGVPTA